MKTLIKYLVVLVLGLLVGAAPVFAYLKNKNDAAVAELIKQVKVKDEEIKRLKIEMENNVKVVFRHNDNCRVEM